ncbi:TIGR03503 family protein [Aliidiomarina sp. B3213]|uniref:TIGR03503 family protein n=1 Tax=Aliidiomarina sp. B3213 TaxID=2249757 RepID=UPI00140412A4|nr:TIGR03503 family protein [Aliidiomarina sp. B3213]
MVTNRISFRVKELTKAAVNGLALVFCCAFLGAFPVNAQSDEMNENDPRRAFTLLEQEPRQQLPLENDRFRIDYEVDEIILVFFRLPDTAPVVLTRPDGSKWYASRHPQGEVTWHSGHDFDMIRIREPMPGPWQATGMIRPNSRAMVYTDVQLHPEDFPELVFVGERLRLEGHLTENGEPVSQLDFRSAIKLEIKMQSTNNPNYDNFGQPPLPVGEFLDDGRGMDAVPRDGTFTGQFELDIASGEYIPTFYVETPLHRRVVEGDVMMVRQVPVRPRMEVSDEEGEPHRMFFTVDEEYVRLDDIVVSGRVDFPNGETENIALSTRQGDELYAEIPSYTFGVFEVVMRLSATDVNGREFQLNIPPFDFRAQPPAPPGPTAAEIAAAEAAEQERIHQQELAEIEAERQKVQNRIILVVGINLGIVALWSIYILIRPSASKRKLKAAKKKKKKKDKKGAEDEMTEL